jgi:hypothetical protein
MKSETAPGNHVQNRKLRILKIVPSRHARDNRTSKLLPEMHTEEQKHAYVLGVCERVESRFTLREIVARIASERPEMILEFAQVWGRLIRDEAIALCSSGTPNTYRLTGVRRVEPMELDEEPLRRALQGPDAEERGHAILDAVAKRQLVRITMSDGSTIRLTDVSDSLNTLREQFGWRPKGCGVPAGHDGQAPLPAHDTGGKPGAQGDFFCRSAPIDTLVRGVETKIGQRGGAPCLIENAWPLMCWRCASGWSVSSRSRRSSHACTKSVPR